MTRTYLLSYAPVVLMLALGFVACGASGTPSGTTTNATSGSSAQFALAQCMRSHGVPNFPDPRTGPNGGGEGFSIIATPGSSTVTIDGTRFAGSAFESAVKTCKLFGGGSGPPPVTAAEKRRAVAFAECMRKHGVPDFPDPTFPAAGGIGQSGGAAIKRNSPAVQAAVAVCNKESS
jgi:hypothetical protein